MHQRHDNDEQALLAALNEAKQGYRNAVRWMREAWNYKRTFSATEDWSAPDMFQWLKNDASISVTEAYVDIKKFRKKIDKYENKLIALKGGGHASDR